MSSRPSPTPVFGTQLMGETEKALGGILARLLAGSGLTERQWVTLTYTLQRGSTVDRDELAGAVAAIVTVELPEARGWIDGLASAGLVALADEDGTSATVTLTDAGRRLHGDIRAQVAPIASRLWGDLPPDDLATAARVLAAVRDRAHTELAGLAAAA